MQTVSIWSPALVSNCRQAKAHNHTHTHLSHMYIHTATVCVCSLFNDIRVSLFITSRMLLAFDNILYLSISIAEKATQYKPSHPLSSPYLPFSHCTLLLCTKTVVWALLLETCESNKDRKGEEATVAQWIMHAHTHTDVDLNGLTHTNVKARSMNSFK